MRGAPVAMGRAGTVTRLLTLAWGGAATYAAARGGAATAPGQLDVDALLSLHDVTSIGPRTRRYALIGSDLSRSPSAAMHVAGYRALGLDARYFGLECENFESFREAIAIPGYLRLDAFGATMPHKESAAAACRTLDEIARTSLSANTVLVGRDGEGWSGHNTDAPGAVAALGVSVDLAGARVALVGAGGTAKAVGYALTRAGARIAVFNRDRNRGARLAEMLDGETFPLDGLSEARWDVLVQTTPLGVDGARWLGVTGVVEGPRGGRVRPGYARGRDVGRWPTALVADARAAGLSVVDGAELLVGQQGIRQFELPWATVSASFALYWIG